MLVAISGLFLLFGISVEVSLPVYTQPRLNTLAFPYRFTYVPPPWLQAILNQPSTSASTPMTPFQKEFVNTIEFPYNQLVPPNEASMSYPLTKTLENNERVLADLTLLPPNKMSWPIEKNVLYTVMLIDVSIQNSQSVIQWAVTNIEGNNVAGGDEFMEYVTPVAWRNCFDGATNHGDACTGNGIIYDPDYVHRNVLYVFKQTQGRVTVEPGERNTGCQMNLQSSISNTGTWSYDNLMTFTRKYNLELHAATWFATPYSPMVDKVLCRYHLCYGNVFSAFLAPSAFPTTLTSLTGVTDRPECGPQKFYSSTGNHPLALDNGQRSPIDWNELHCTDCTAMVAGNRKVSPGFTGIHLG